MLSRARLPVPVDAAALAREVVALPPDCWIPHFNQAGYEGDWSGAPLRSPGGALGRITANPAGPEPYADTPLMTSCPTVSAVLDALACEPLAVRLLRLGPGARVLEHRDGGLGLESGEVRIHVPVTTNPGVEFRHAGRTVNMQLGEAWYLNLELPHSVSNQGDSGRIHLVIDCQRNLWLERLIAQVASDGLATARGTRGGTTVWLTGRAGSGRTALATAIIDRLEQLGEPAALIDQAVDVAEVGTEATAARALAVASRGVVAVVDNAYLDEKDRQRVRAQHEDAGIGILEVFLDCQREICELRVHYSEERRDRPPARADEPAFQAPPAPEVHVHSDREKVGEEAELVLTALAELVLPLSGLQAGPAFRE